ncbi:MAG: glycosyltransferase family 39 protein [Anaerolineae bacterium]
MHTRHRRWILIPLLLLAFGLRVWGLAEHNIWWDEGIGVWLARMPVSESVRWTAGDVHPPLYYVLLHGWRSFVGEGEFALRLLSALFSLLTVPLIYRLGQTLGGYSVGFLSALLLTLSRFSIWWAQEIRMYALAAMFATGALWAAVWFLKERSRLDTQAPVEAGEARKQAWIAWLLYVAMTLGSLAALYLTVTVVIVTNLGFLAMVLSRAIQSDGISQRKTVVQWIAAQLTVGLLFLPWVLYALPRMHGWSSDAPFSPGFFLQLYTTMLAVGTPLDLAEHLPIVAAVFSGLILGTVALGRRVRTPAEIGGLTLLLSGLLLPPLVVVVISLPALQFYIARPLVPRYLLPLSGCYVVLLAWGIKEVAGWRDTGQATSDRIRPGSRILAGIMAGTALLAALVGLIAYYPGRARRDDYVTISEVLLAHRRQDEALVLYVDRDWPIFAAHYGGPRKDLAYGANLSDPAVVEAQLEPLWASSNAVWLVSTPESLQADPQRQVPRWLGARAVVSETLVTGEISLTYYARTPDRAALRATVVPGFIAPAEIGAPFGLTGVSIPLPRYHTGDTLHLGLYWIAPMPETGSVILQGENVVRAYDVHQVSGDLNLLRSQVDIPWTPDLAAGTYRLYVEVAGYEPVVVGDVELIARTLGTDRTPETIPNPIDVRFEDAAGGERLTLIGYELGTTQVKAGDAVPLTLYWRAEMTLSRRYKVFTHLLGETFNARTGTFLWGQQDNEPVNGQAPTTLWTPGAIIEDPYLIPVDPQAPQGAYTLEVGLYGLVDGVRLSAQGPEGAIKDDAVLLTTVTVVAGE